MTSQDFMSSRNSMAATLIAILASTICTLTLGVIPASAQTFSTLHNFCVETNCTDGDYPMSGLIQGTDGNYYGTTYYGGANGAGSVYSITSEGTLTTFYSFCEQLNCADGETPMASLLLASDGNVYGTTSRGGANGYGTIFSLTAEGILTTLYNFCSLSGCADGETPGPLMQASDGNFYGITSGDSFFENPTGTLFQLTPGGTLTTLHSFCLETGCADGAFPSGPLVEGADGSLYGVTSGDGYISNGTVFRITTAGVLTTLHSFCSQGGLCKDGLIPMGGLVLGSDGDFYGTTEEGGTTDCLRGKLHTGRGCGTIFKIDSAGSLQTLLSFPGTRSGVNPVAQLVLATDGNFYGAALFGGTNTNLGCSPVGCGTLFQTTSDGGLRTVHNFAGYLIDGYYTQSGLVQGTNGDFYGATRFGGTIGFCEFGCGTAFRLSLGLEPFVKAVPASGKAGNHVVILGNNLSAASAVKFDGVVADFKVISATYITATVPAGATTGEVQVMTPGGNVTSKAAFKIRQ